MKLIFTLLFLMVYFPSLAFAAAPKPCAPVISITSLRGVLYKNANLHGGRGPTFLVQNEKERTGKRSILIKDKNCKDISAFGLFATDKPYGARYYEGVRGGKYHSAKKLKSLSKGYILVEGKNKWIKIPDPTVERIGNISK